MTREKTRIKHEQWSALWGIVRDLDALIANRIAPRYDEEIPLPKKQLEAPPRQGADTGLETRKESLSPSYEKIAADSSDWEDEIPKCTSCRLGVGKEGLHVIGMGNKKADLLVVVNPASVKAEKQAQPLAADELDYFLKWMSAIGMAANFYLTNISKCRPPGNRAPFPGELKTCAQHLENQLKTIQPRLIFALGGEASRFLTGKRQDLSSLRANLFQYNGIDMLVSYAPRDVLLRPEELRGLVWEDLQKLRELLGK